MFIVAACNPHRGNSLAMHIIPEEKWIQGSYYVRRLHPTLQLLLWDYGSLSVSQERDYINSKVKMLIRHKSVSNGATAGEKEYMSQAQVNYCCKKIPFITHNN